MVFDEAENRTEDISNANFTIQVTYYISGHVKEVELGSHGLSLAGVKVYLSGNKQDTTQTDTSGYYSFLHLLPGRYFVFRDSAEGCYDINLSQDTSGLNFVGYSSTGETQQDEQIPDRFQLSQNFPNPFNPVTEIKYALPKDCQVKIAIYNILGQKIRTLVNEYHTAGCRLVKWDGRDDADNVVTSGVYFYKIKAGGFTESKKMVLIK